MRIIFKLNESRDQQESNNIINLNNITNLNSTLVNEILDPNLPLFKKMLNENLACRICLCDNCDDQKNNPIIQPCKCIGTMKYVHLECFKCWIKKQVLIKHSDNLISYYWKKLQCELCQHFINSKIVI